jgi:hypothetical protein
VFTSSSVRSPRRRKASSGGPSRVAFRSRQAQCSLSRPRHGSAASARRAALASHPPLDALVGFLNAGEGTAPSRFQGGLENGEHPQDHREHDRQDRRQREGQPAGKAGGAELHFGDGPLAGLKLIGFAIWERRSGSGRNVTFPARQYSVNGERRSFALLRPIADVTVQERIRDLVLEAYAEYEAAAAAQA